MAHAVDPKHEWAIEIGRIAIAFGSIEHITMVSLRHLPADPIYPAMRHLKLAPRLDLLLSILSGSADRSAGPLSELLRTAKKLADDRNAVLHNPLMLEVFEDRAGTYEFKHAIQLLRQERTISFDDLVAIREKAERLATELYVAATSILERQLKLRRAERGADA